MESSEVEKPGTGHLQHFIVDEEVNQLDLVPFIVSHTQRFQDTIILSPQGFGVTHDAFIGKLYAGSSVHRVSEFVQTVFNFGPFDCIAQIFYTNCKDDGGRSRLPVAIGVAKRRKHGQRTLTAELVSRYLLHMMEGIHLMFGVNIQADGADRLLMLIDAPSKEERWQFNMFVAWMISLSSIASEAGAFSRRRLGWGRLGMWKLRRKCSPCLIIVPSNVDLQTLAQIGCSEMVGLSKMGVNGEACGGDEYSSKNGMQFLRLEAHANSILSDIRGGESVCVKGKNILVLYGNCNDQPR